MSEQTAIISPCNSVSKSFFARGTLWNRKISMDPHTLAHLNIQRQNDMYLQSKKKYIPEIIIDRYQYIPEAYLTAVYDVTSIKMALATWVQGLS
jgi:hypothetical protein